MKAFIAISDAEDGTLTLEGGLENPEEILAAGSMSGAAIYWSFLTQNSDRLMEEAAVWFADKVKLAAGDKDDKPN
jgi:hypothetical protein